MSPYSDEKIKVFSGNSNRHLAAEICEHVGVTEGAIEVGRFSNGEIKVIINENVRGTDVFVVQPTCNPVNDNLMELLIIIDALRRASASRITCNSVLRLCPPGPEDSGQGADNCQTGSQSPRNSRGEQDSHNGPSCRADPGLLRHPCGPPYCSAAIV